MDEIKSLVEKWEPILDIEGAAPIKDSYRKKVTAILLENQERLDLLGLLESPFWMPLKMK